MDKSRKPYTALLQVLKRFLFQFMSKLTTKVSPTDEKLLYHLRALQRHFTKLAKSHLSAQFLVRVFVLGWYIYFETAQVLVSFVSEKRGSKL